RGRMTRFPDNLPTSSFILHPSSFALGCLIALALSIPSDLAYSQSYPTKPIRLIVPFPPGGGNDIVGRIIAQRLAEGLGRQVIVDNRGGAGGTIGTDLA